MRSIILLRIAFAGIERSTALEYDTIDWRAIIKALPDNYFLKISVVKY